MIRAIQEVHEKGYIHRDVKSSNFVLGAGKQRTHMYIVDFGIARKHLRTTGEPMPQRDAAEFRGTTTYASIEAHQGGDLSRRDDLWSLFYILLDLLVGELPWRHLR